MNASSATGTHAALELFYQPILAALTTTDPSEKCAQVAELQGPDLVLFHEAARAHRRAHPSIPATVLPSPPGLPGRPELPQLVPPKRVPTRGLGTVAGRAALAHAVAHIEFNAINLALDACWRFRGLPADYYADWLSVAQDEARHFGLMRTRLQAMASDYGQFLAHNGLWEAAEKTAHDFTTRMACVPRVLEARGLDVTPGIIARLTQAADQETVAVLQVILQEEVRHVAIGTRWFHYGCAVQNLPTIATFKRLLAEQGMGLRPPFNTQARSAAGFVPEEYLAEDTPAHPAQSPST